MSLIEWATLIISAIGGITGLGSLWFTHVQWEKVKSKVTLITNSTQAFDVVPAWHTHRMMNDDWLFGLLTSDCRLIIIRKVTAVSSDGKWMTVELAEKDDVSQNLSKYGAPIFAVAADRKIASIQINSVVAAMDLQTS